MKRPSRSVLRLVAGGLTVATAATVVPQAQALSSTPPNTSFDDAGVKSLGEWLAFTGTSYAVYLGLTYLTFKVTYAQLVAMGVIRPVPGL